MQKENIRQQLGSHGRFEKIKKWNPTEAKTWLNDRSLWAIDGSINNTKGSSNSIFILQALAKSITGEEEWSADVYTPLLDLDKEVKVSGLLATLELELTLSIISKYSPNILFLDGTLLHFYRENNDKCDQMISNALNKKSKLIGIAEEISTNLLSDILFPQFKFLTDKILFSGLLEIGECFIWDNYFMEEKGLWRCCFRSSKNPHPILIDGPVDQYDDLSDLLSLVYTLTPEQGRGIPLWLDIVDREVRVTNGLLDALLDKYIDPELRKRLLTSKRAERII